MRQDQFGYEAADRTLIIHMPRELDHHSCSRLKVDTDLLLAENDIRRLVFDFTETVFMDSSGIGMLFNRYKQMAASHGEVTYYGAGPRVRRILEIGGMERLIRGCRDKEEALE